MNLWRFFLCEVFFFGTALSIDSHKPDKMDGILRVKFIGIAIDNLGRAAEMSCWEIFKALLVRIVGWYMMDHGETMPKEGRKARARAMMRIYL